MNKCRYCGFEMEYYDGGDQGQFPEIWECTGCGHVCFVNSETGEIECECEQKD